MQLDRQSGAEGLVERVEDAVARLRAAAVEKGDFAMPAARDHQLSDAIVSAGRELLAMGDEGTKAFRALLDDESHYVRTWVAVGFLADGDSHARAVLEEISAYPGPSGFNAKMALQEYDGGRLRSPFDSQDSEGRSAV
jgi:hypothetical protein